MDADFIGAATELLTERANIGGILKALDEGIALAVVIPGTDIIIECDAKELDGLSTDLRKRLAVIQDQLTAGGVMNLPEVMPSVSIRELIEAA